MASKVFKNEGPGCDVSFNLTPMIDVTFQLIIFFILTSQIASEALAKLELAKPLEPQVINTEGEGELGNKIIVNVLFKDEAVPTFDMKLKINGNDITDKEVLTKKLREALQNSSKKDEFFLEIRADKRVPYQDIIPVMQAAGNAKIVNMGLTALDDARGGEE